ncbi:MAG: hypothetical protein ACI835_004155 [Planctomycetota bacterium]|jgi:hypothetical protein
MVRYLLRGALLDVWCRSIRNVLRDPLWRSEEYGASLQVTPFLPVGSSSLKGSKSILHSDRRREVAARPLSNR